MERFKRALTIGLFGAVMSLSSLFGGEVRTLQQSSSDSPKVENVGWRGGVWIGGPGYYGGYGRGYYGYGRGYGYGYRPYYPYYYRNYYYPYYYNYSSPYYYRW